MQEIILDNKKKIAEIATLVEKIKLNNQLIERYKEIEANAATDGDSIKIDLYAEKPNAILNGNPIPNIDSTKLYSKHDITYVSHDIGEHVFKY